MQEAVTETAYQEKADDTEFPEEPLTVDPKDLLLTGFPENLHSTEDPDIAPSTDGLAVVVPPANNDGNTVQEALVQLRAKNNHATDDTQDDLYETAEENPYYSHFDEYMDLWHAGQES